MNIKSNKFVISLNHSRGFGGVEELTSASDLRTWEAISKNFSSIDEVPPEFGNVRIKIDWSPAITYSRRLYELYQQPIEVRVDILKNNHKFFDFDIACEAIVEFESQPEVDDFWFGDDILKHYLYNIFLLGNLSSPGAVNFYKSHIRAKGAPSEYSPLAVTDLVLSEYIFEDSWHEAQHSSWAKVGFIDFDNVLSWHNGLHVGCSQVARTKMQKLLFGLLHISKHSIDTPEATIWISGLLENIFDAKMGASFQQLYLRLSTFLGLDDKEKAAVKKQLRNFFDLRHGFAHGGAPIYHPIGNEVWDKQVDNRYEDIQVLNSFAATLLISVAQEIIRRNLIDFQYRESFVELKG